MTRSGNHDWKWPDQKDEIVYDINDVIEVIALPQKKNTRGVYMVPEMNKY